MQLFLVLLVAANLAITPIFSQPNPLDVPVPWTITNIEIGNTRHGTGGYWSFDIVDTPTLSPQGFNTTCYYYSNSYYFAMDQPPYNATCDDPSVTFGFFPYAEFFQFNITHIYGYTSSYSNTYKDNGTWWLSIDDVSGQQNDVENDFGQAGYFAWSDMRMYPQRDVLSWKCEFC